MKGINIRVSRQHDFAMEVVTGLKSIETRECTSLNSLIGQRVGVVRTAKGERAVVVGYVTIAGVKEYLSEPEFRKDECHHLIRKGDDFDIRTKKYGYILAEPEVECHPYEPIGMGIVIRKIK